MNEIFPRLAQSIATAGFSTLNEDMACGGASGCAGFAARIQAGRRDGERSADQTGATTLEKLFQLEANDANKMATASFLTFSVQLL